MVRFRAGVPRAEAWRAWAAHTREWDARDHPQIRHTQLTLFAPGGGFDGMALTVWSSQAAFREAAAWYETPASAAHTADLARFLDFEGMVTVVLEDEAGIPGPPDAGAR